MCFAIARGRMEILPDDLKEGERFIMSLLEDLHEVLLQAEVHGFGEYCQLIERLLISREKMPVNELREHVRCPGQMFDDLVQWAKDTKLAKVTGPAAKEDIELFNKKRTPWGRPRNSKT